MSMIGNLARVSPQQLEALHRDPEGITRLLYHYVTETPAAAPGFFGRLLGRKAEAIKPVPTIGPLGEGDSIDLDKAWHSLHFLFTGTAWEGEFPRGFLVRGGRDVGKVDVGYGPARSFMPEEVTAIAAFLDSLNEAELRGRLDPVAMREADVYGTGESDAISDEEWGYLYGAFENARNFIRETAIRQLALLVYIN